MASKPVFVKSRNDLLERLRVKNADPKGGVQRILDTAITEVRVGIYNELGTARVAEIAAFAATDNPETAAELERADGIIMETKWVRANLLQVLKVFFADESGGADQEWNELGILRDSSEKDQDDLVASLLSDVGDALERLKTQVTTASRQVRASSFGVEETGLSRLEPGATIRN